MFGYNGKVLIADLSSKTFDVKDLNPEWARDYIGGAPLGARYLMDLMPAKTPVFAPESVIGFVSGPLNATKALLGARWTVVSKSPVNDRWNDANCGGTFGPAIRKTGFDAIFVKGSSEKPVYLLIDEGKPELRDATAIWGKTTSDAEAAIRAEHGNNLSIAQIGPAGENLSYMAAIINDAHRAAGRGGSGAVMGSKKLKAVVCKGGNAEISVKDDATLVALNKECVEAGKPGGACEMSQIGFKDSGTSRHYDSSVMSGAAPCKNWQGVPDIDYSEEMAKNLIGPVLNAKYREKSEGCANCFIKCTAYYKLDNGKYKTDHATRPEFESLAAFGSALLLADQDTAVTLNWLCNQYGYDTISFGSTIAWAMECYDKGIISKEEMDGIELKWGDKDATMAIAERIFANQGIGAVLNLASQGAADKLGKGFECLVVASGIELPYQHGANNPALARTFQYDATPGRHVKGGRGVPFGNKPPEIKYNFEGTGKDDAEGLQEWEVTNACGICGFAHFNLPHQIYIKMLNAITGFDYTPEQLLQFAYRAYTLRFSFNLREGYRRKDYTLSERAIGNPPPSAGPLKGRFTDGKKLADNFFGYLGWDLETAVPPLSFLQEVGGLECVIDFLYPN